MAQYKKGKIVKGTITGIEDYGIFVSLDNFYSGLIHISEISNGFVSNPKNFAKVGETIYVKVLEVDENTNHVKLSIKDIDYKIYDEYTKCKLKEVGRGFYLLSSNLDKWVSDKLKEIGR